jgi:hypothetical protein
VRYRPTLRWIPHEANLRRAREHLARIKSRIAAGMFRFIDEFPSYRGRYTLRIPLSARTCADVFEAFLHHEQAQVARGDLAPVTKSVPTTPYSSDAQLPLLGPSCVLSY